MNSLYYPITIKLKGVVPARIQYNTMHSYFVVRPSIRPEFRAELNGRRTSRKLLQANPDFRKLILLLSSINIKYNISPTIYYPYPIISLSLQ